MTPARGRLDFDIAVVGGGMVGQCLAALLAADEHLAAWRVALIDPAVPRQPNETEVDLRVSALSRASQKILSVAGAWAPLEAHACPYSDMVVWDATSTADARDALRFSAAESGEPNLGHIVENLRVQWALHESPRLRGTTQLRAGLSALEFEPDFVRLTLTDDRRVSCGLVVGADGGPSPTRELAGIGRAGAAYDQSAVVAHLRTGRPHRDTAWQRFLPEGPLALLPLRDGRVSLVWTTTPAEGASLLAASPEDFSAAVTAASDRVLGEMVLDSGRAVFPLALWHAREYVRARLALVGDAAHTIHPLAGQGVNLGFLDCAALVQVLSSAIAEGEDPAGLRVLRRYERWRRGENALVLGFTDGIGRLFGETSMAVSGIRRLGMSIVAAQPILRRTLVQRALGLSGDLPAIVTRPG